MIHMKYQDLFSSGNKKKSKLSSALVVIGALRANRRRDKEHFCVFYASVKSRYSIVLKIKHIRYAEHFFPIHTSPSFDAYLIYLHFSPYSRLSSVFSLIRGKIRTIYCHKWMANQFRFFKLWTYCKAFYDNAKTKDSRYHTLSSLEAKIIGRHIHLWNTLHYPVK